MAIADLDQRAADAATAEIDDSGKRAIGSCHGRTNEQQLNAGTAKVVKTFGTVGCCEQRGIQVVAPVVEFVAKWKQMLAVRLDSSFPRPPAPLRQMYKRVTGSIVHISAQFTEGSEAQRPASPPSTGTLAWPGWSPRKRRAVPRQRDLPGFVPYSAGQRQPRAGEEARAFQQEVIDNVMKDTVDHEFTTWTTSPRRHCSSPPSIPTR